MSRKKEIYVKMCFHCSGLYIKWHGTEFFQNFYTKGAGLEAQPWILHLMCILIFFLTTQDVGKHGNETTCDFFIADFHLNFFRQLKMHQMLLMTGFDPEREVAIFSRLSDDLSQKIWRPRQNCLPP